ncbi:MAG: MFS transporter, partial [Thermoproteus sp.]
MRDRMWHVLSVTTLASFLAGLNARLAVVGLPTIAESLKADLEQAFWITQGFMLGSTAVQLVAGRLADLYGRVRLFSFGFILFAVGALLSGLSPSPIAIIASRIVQGAGSAFLMSLSVVILTDNAPKERLGTWLGVNQTAWRAGAIVGLSVSGFVIDLLGWRWLFLGQVPIALASYFWARSRLEEAYRPAEEAVVDWAGFFLFTTAVSALLAGLTLYVYGSHRLLSYALLASVPPLLAGFALYELKAEAPAMDLRIFRNWQYTGGVIAGTLYSVAFGAT